MLCTKLSYRRSTHRDTCTSSNLRKRWLIPCRRRWGSSRTRRRIGNDWRRTKSRQHRRHRHPRWSQNREPSRSRPWFCRRSIARTTRCCRTSWPSSSHRTCTSSPPRRHRQSCPGSPRTSLRPSTYPRRSSRCTSRSPRKPAESRNRRTSPCHRDTTRTTTSRHRRYSTRRTRYPGTYTPSTPPPCSSSRLGTPHTRRRIGNDWRRTKSRQHRRCPQPRCRRREPSSPQPWFYRRSIARTTRCCRTSGPSSSRHTCTSSRSRRRRQSWPGRPRTSLRPSTCSQAQFATHTLVVSSALSPKIVEPVFDEPVGHAVHVLTVAAGLCGVVPIGARARRRGPAVTLRIGRAVLARAAVQVLPPCTVVASGARRCGHKLRHDLADPQESLSSDELDVEVPTRLTPAVDSELTVGWR